MMIRRGGGGGAAAGGSAHPSSSSAKPPDEYGAGDGKRGSLSKFRRTTTTTPANRQYQPQRRAQSRRTTVGALVLLLMMCGVGPAVLWRVWEGRHYHLRQEPRPNNPIPTEAVHPHPPDLKSLQQDAAELAGATKTSQKAQSTAARADQKQPATATKTTADTLSSRSNATVTVESVRQQFYDRYGGREAALQIFHRGVRAYGNSLQNTAQRFLHAAATNQPFVLAFAGYSVTVGRGNHYRQSFPFVLERVLQPLAHDALGDMPIVVRNAAIGGIPSFPYGFCFEHFLGPDASVVSWDYSMNEGPPYGASVLESYLRHAQGQLRDTRPMVIVLDTNVQRCQLLQQYAEKGWVPDALCLGTAKDVIDDVKSLPTKPRDSLPEGFRDWDAFGAPPNCPGRGSWHPKRQEHELIGWMLAMYFVDAIEQALQHQQKNGDWKSQYRTLSFVGSHQASWNGSVAFPPPLSSPPPNADAAVTHLLYGHPVADNISPDKDSNTPHHMHHVSCRTSFLPAQDHEKVLPSIVASGLSPAFEAAAASGTPAEDGILRDRTDIEYQTGWVLDVSQVERDTKRKVDACGGLGYVDMKIALYGVPESGTLRLWLPVSAAHEKGGATAPAASDHVQELVLCEANEKRPDQACRLDRDVRYTVGGVPVEGVAMIRGAGEYLKRSTCVHVGIPTAATLTALPDLHDTQGQPSTADVRRRLAGRHPAGSTGLGLVVDVLATSPVTRKGGACCISHVVWEHSS